MITDDDLCVMVERHGWSGKLVRAIQARMGWRPAHRGEVAVEWYAAFRGWLGDALERVARGDEVREGR